MTRRLVALLVLAAALPAAAQPTDAGATEVLIGRVVERQRLGDYAGIPFGAYPTGVDGIDTAAATDSVTAAFRRDARPDLLREALLCLDTPAAIAFERRTRLHAPTDRELGNLVGTQNTKKGAVADSVLAARYSRALATDAFMAGLVAAFVEQTIAQATEGTPNDAWAYADTNNTVIPSLSRDLYRLDHCGTAPCRILLLGRDGLRRRFAVFDCVRADAHSTQDDGV